MKPALLDTNVLLALAWPNHQHHASAHQWFRREARYGWASCAVTQLGFIRLSSNPAYTDAAVRPAEAATLLHEWTQHEKHAFWPSPAADRSSVYALALGHQQVNDAYLLDVAKARRGRFVTFDRRLQVHAAEEGLVLVISG
ncbi:type II toxin-antitoxin system VapC family toxin [soil metagenome]